MMRAWDRRFSIYPAAPLLEIGEVALDVAQLAAKAAVRADERVVRARELAEDADRAARFAALN
jgi:hypothetical protein